MIEYRPAATRSVTRDEGRTTYHSFAFGRHYDPGNTGFGALTALNQEHLPAGTGYAAHRHADVELVTVVLRGALRHTSDVGHRLLEPGMVQRLSAGSGVEHAEVNAIEEETVFLQAWLRPDASDLVPSYDVGDLGAAASSGGWLTVAGAGGVVPLATSGTTLHAALLGPGDALALPEAELLHAYVAHGRLQLAERVLEPGDAARLTGEGGRTLKAETEGQVWVWSFT